mgnify:CR=1 FL=1
MPVMADWTDGYKSESFEVVEFDGMSEPSVAPSGKCRLYFDSSTTKWMLSKDGGAYAEVGSGGGGSQDLFGTISVGGQDNIVADTTTDTLTLAEGANITITTDAGTDTATIAATTSDSLQVNSSPVDTTGNLLDGDIDFTLVDGGAGGPDNITASLDATYEASLDVATAAALAANGANCAAGEIALGVDASGVVEGCYEPSETDISDLVHTATDITANIVDFNDIKQNNTLAGNPALLVDECFHIAIATGGGFICEGSTADTNEQLYLFPDANGADTSQTIATEDGNIATATALAANGANCAAGEIALGVDASGAVEGCYEPAEADISDLSHTTDTGPSPDCSGTTTYQDGEGGCDDISSVYQPLDSELTTIAGLTETNGNVMFVAGGAWTSDATPAIDCTDCTNLPASGMTSFILEDDDGTEVSISDAEEVKFIDSTGLTINWTDTSTGSDADPFDLTFTIEATLADIADGTIAENLVNTANPWADNEVADDITIDLATAASALNANGANCAAGEIALGVDASGAVEGCYEPAEADISDLNHTATAITDNLIINADLNIDVEGVDGDFMQYDSTGDNFTWRSGSETLSDIGAEGDLANEAGLYAALSDVTNFLQTGDALAGDDITNGTVDETELATTINFADGTLLDFGSNVTSATEGLMLPAHATDCSTATAEGQACWEEDAKKLYIGDGATAVELGAGGGAFSDAGDPIVQNTTTKDTHFGDGAGTLTGKLEIGGDADQPQVVIEGHSSQTDDIVIIQQDDDTELVSISPSPSLKMKEVADAPGDTAAYGQFWVNTATPNEAYFTDDAGTDFRLGTSGDVTAGSNITDNRIVRGDGGSKGIQESTATISDNGEMVNTSQPCFMIHAGANTNLAEGSAIAIDFPTEVFDIGGNFASDTFTAPVTGKYSLGFNIIFDDMDSAATYFRINFITSNREYECSRISGNNFPADALNVPISVHIIADMDANDTAYIQWYQSGGTAQVDTKTTSNFYGGLLN